MRIMTEQECSLVEAHMALVETVIRRHITVRPEIPGMEHDDLFQVGSLALCRAAQRYDGRCQFSTFAYTVVKNALLDHCRSIMGKASRTVALEQSDDEDGGSLLNRIADRQSIPDTVEARDLLRALAKARKQTAALPARASRPWKCRCTATPPGRSPNCTACAATW